MSNDKQLAVRDGNTQVSSRYNEADIQAEMGILKAAFPKMADDVPPEGLRALIIASKFSGLNPFRGEIFYIPKVGISVASKIKAADAVSWAAAHGNTLNIRFEPLTELHPEYQQIKLDRGDVAEVCIIISSKQRNEYFKWRLQVIDELKALGYKGRELEDELNKRCGKTAPETRAVGIVKAGEFFGHLPKSGAEMFTRKDRAQKRALQKALNIGGFAAPDMRNYGGVRLSADEPASESTVESPYRVVESGVSGAAEMPYDDVVEEGEASFQQRYEPEQAPSAEASPALKPVSKADRAMLSALLDRHNALVELSRGAASMSDEQKQKFIADVDAVIGGVNHQLAVRELPQIEHDDKVNVRFKRMTAAINSAIAHDEKAPTEEAQPA
jgi:hypothetical protein